MIRTNCTCAEGRLMEPDGNTKPHIREAMLRMPRDKQGKIVAPPVHDCDYVKMRNEMIPKAERAAAISMVRDRGYGWEERPANMQEFTRRFMGEMDRLCGTGAVSPSPDAPSPDAA